MKILTLLRHAKSAWDDPVARDFDRPLNRRGRRAARTVGREMHRLGLRFDRVLASPALRVRETLDEIVAGYGDMLAPLWEKRIYLASAATLLELVHEADDADTRLLLVGHNPGLESMALLLGGNGDARREIAIKYPTAALVEISLPVDSWADAAEGAGAITRFIRPRDLDPELGPED